MTDELRRTVRELMPALLCDLGELVRVQSVSADPSRAGEVRRAADSVADLLRAEGFAEVETVAADGGAPAVIAHKPGPNGAPTVLLYAHHDVQPEGDLRNWNSTPFEPIRRDSEQGERLYGRGAADDKAGIAAHLGAIRALGDDLPVDVVVFIEGEEEVGSASVPALLTQYRPRLRADAIVIADSTNWTVGQPALTTSLRGLVSAEIEIRTLDHAVHSGMWGGLLPDALMAMSRLITSLHDDSGNVAVAGLTSEPSEELDYSEERIRAESGVLDSVELIGCGTVVGRLWNRSALTVTELSTPTTNGASHSLAPVARASLSLRVAPGDTAANALERLREHCETHVPWGARLRFVAVDQDEPIRLDARGPAYNAARAAFTEAWEGIAPVEIGIGGSIPFITHFLNSFPEASVLVTGVEDPDTQAHGPNEGLHLAEFERVVLAEALFLRNFAKEQCAGSA